MTQNQSPGQATPGQATTTMTAPMLRDAAVAAAERGWAVFPLKPGEKAAKLKDWPNKACADPERVARYWPSDRHNVAVATGPSRLVVVDLDVPKDDEGLTEGWQLPGVHDGKDVFVQICEWAGMDWPYTYTVATPSGGWHLYFAAPEGSGFRNTVRTIGPLIDTRANGGYVVGAGSVTAAGAYEVLYDEPVIELPRWIARLLTPPEPEMRFTSETVPRPSGPGRLQGGTARRPTG